MRRRSLSAALVLLTPLSGLALVPSARAEQVIDPARQAYIDRADAICLKSALRMERALRAYETHKIDGFGTKGAWRADPKAVATYVTKVAAPEIGGQIKSLRLLKPPEEDATAVRSILTTAQKELDALVKGRSAAAFTNPFEKSSKAMGDFGFAVCGSDERPADRKPADRKPADR